MINQLGEENISLSSKTAIYRWGKVGKDLEAETEVETMKKHILLAFGLCSCRIQVYLPTGDAASKWLVPPTSIINQEMLHRLAHRQSDGGIL